MVYSENMKKENIIILVVITFIVAFVLGAVCGISSMQVSMVPGCRTSSNTAQQDALLSIRRKSIGLRKPEG